MLRVIEDPFIIVLIGVLLFYFLMMGVVWGLSIKKEKEKIRIFIHKETGNEYTMIKEGKVKINHEWKACVIYSSQSNEMYVRDINEFCLKFREKQ